MILILLTDLVNQKQTRPPTLLLGLSLEEPETIFIKKEGNWKVMLQETYLWACFHQWKPYKKEINIYFPWPMKKEKKLTGNTFEPTTEEFFSDKAMTAELLLSEVKKTLNISKTLWTTLQIPTKFLHLNQFENSPILPFDMVSGLPVISLSWCVVLYIFIHLFNNHDFVQNLWYAQLFALCPLFFMS